MSPLPPDNGITPEQNRLLPAPLEDRLVKILGRACGVALLIVIATVWLTLVTWSVSDPSLTFATGGKAHNALGALGAILSDLLLQMLGLATAVVLLAPMHWALELTLAERVPGFRAKASFYPLSVIVLAGAFSTLPVPQNWPLHHALGGILGDVVANLGATILGAINPERAFLATGLVLFGTGFTTLLYSLGLEPRDVAKLVERAPAEPAIATAGEGIFTRLWKKARKPDEQAQREPAFAGQMGARPGQPHGYGPAGYDAYHADAWHAAAADAEAYAAYQDAHYQAQAAQAYYQRGLPVQGDYAAAAQAGFAGYPPHAYAHVPQQPAMPQPQAGAPAAYAAHYDPVFGASQPMPQPHAHTPAMPLAAHGGPLQPEFHPSPREPMFDMATDIASRNIAERFAPATSEARPAAQLVARAGALFGLVARGEPVETHETYDTATAPEAMQPRAAAAPAAAQPMPAAIAPEPQRAPAKASGLLGGLGLRRAEAAYKRPSLNLLKKPAASRVASDVSQTALRGSARLLEDTLADFGVKGEVRDIKPGPVVTLFEMEPARGTKSARVIGLADDIARSMSANAVRVAVVPGRNAIGIELPNAKRETVFLREILEAEAFKSGEAILPVSLGKSIGGDIVVADLARMPHLLVAGTTGSGKSVGVNAMILSLLYRHSPEDCRMIMIDPKMLELSVYNGIPHLLTPVVTDPAKAVAALNWAVGEMEERYKRMARLNVRNIDVYNNRVRNAKKRGELISRTVQTGFDRSGKAVFESQDMDAETLPYIVIVVDEFADLMIVAGKEIEAAVQRLAQMARAAGIHLIMATQRPSVDIITGTIKANFPTRISFKVTSKIDSRTILNDQGAEQLLGQGDMLYSTGAGQMARVHGPFVSDEEVEQITNFLRAQGEPKYVAGITEAPEAPERGGAEGDGKAMSEDDLYDRAVAIVLRDRKPSTSYIQRRLSIGYNRAADLIERMEREGIVSPASGSGKREILASETKGADAA